MPPILAHHIILTAYAHWLPNDLRGSHSTSLHQPKLAPLAPIHPGRRTLQPDRHTLKTFHRQAAPLLNFQPLWFTHAHRTTIADAFQTVLTHKQYTLYACAICSNHVHLCVRRHRDHADAIANTFAQSARHHLLEKNLLPANHPLWADNPQTLFKHTPAAIRDAIDYINKNPQKENLPPQHWPFVTPLQQLALPPPPPPPQQKITPLAPNAPATPPPEPPTIRACSLRPRAKTLDPPPSPSALLKHPTTHPLHNPSYGSSASAQLPFTHASYPARSRRRISAIPAAVAPSDAPASPRNSAPTSTSR